MNDDAECVFQGMGRERIYPTHVFGGPKSCAIIVGVFFPSRTVIAAHNFEEFPAIAPQLQVMVGEQMLQAEVVEDDNAR